MSRSVKKIVSILTSTILLQACSLSLSSTTSLSSSSFISSSDSLSSSLSISSSSLSSEVVSSSSSIDECWNVVTGTWGSCEISSSSVSSSVVSSSSSASSSASSDVASSSSSLVSSSSSILVSSSVSSSSQSISSSYSSSSDIVYDGYYYGADDLSGTALVSFLREIVTDGFIGITYGDARYFMGIYDADPANVNNVLLIYNRASVSNVWDLGVTWNREHVWPQSRLGAEASNSVANIASDLHNLRAANPSINSSRSNKNFDLITTTTTYFPGEADKGDVARILMYMAIRYSQLNLVSGSPSDATLSIGNLQTLLMWHDQDPPDMFERGRNELIYSGAYVPFLNKNLKQNNRNPFIDHPEFADLIWASNGTLLN